MIVFSKLSNMLRADHKARSYVIPKVSSSLDEFKCTFGCIFYIKTYSLLSSFT